MSDKKEKPKDAKDAKAEGKPKAGILAMLTKTPVLLGIIMTVEAAALFAGFKMFMSSGPQAAEAVLLVPEGADKSADAAHGADAKKDAGHGPEKKADAAHAEPKKDDGHGAAAADHGAGHGDAGAAGHGKGLPVEVALVEIRAPNKLSGRTFIYDISVYAVVKDTKAEEFKAAVKSREASIRDRIRTIVAQLHPDKLGGGNEPGLETLRRQIRYQMEDIAGDGVIDEILVARCIPFRADF